MKTHSSSGVFLRLASGALLLLLLATLASGCTERDDAYVLLRRLPNRKAGAPTPLGYAKPDDSAAPRVRRLLADGFGAELLRTFAMTKRFVRRTAPPDSVPYARAAAPTYLALGTSDTYRGRPYRNREIDGGWLSAAIPAGTPVVWIDDDPTELAQLPPFADCAVPDLPLSERSRDAATTDLIVAGLADAIVNVAAPGPTDFSTDPEPTYPLRDGYVAFLEVVAAEWHPPNDGADPRESLRRAALFADVRANAAARGETGGGRRCGREAVDWPPGAVAPAWWMVRDPTVIATVLYRLAASAIGRRLTTDQAYLPFVEEPPPRGLSGGLLLGAFRNFQAKLLSAWSRAALAGRTPVDLVDLVDAYGDAYPEERAEVTRIFLVTTYGATALPRGVDPRWPDQLASGLAALTADVLFGRRGLRDALRGPAPDTEDSVDRPAPRDLKRHLQRPLVDL